MKARLRGLDLAAALTSTLLAACGDAGEATQTATSGSSGTTTGDSSGDNGDMSTSSGGSPTSGTTEDTGGAVQPDSISLPREVFWKNDEDTVSFTLTAEEAASAAFFAVRLNNIDGPDRVAFGFNDGALVPVNKDTVTSDGLGDGQDKDGYFKYPATRDLQYALPPGTLHAGLNTLRFKYNGVIDDPDSLYQFSMGFRVLSFNIETAEGERLLPQSLFTADDPAQWATSFPAEQVARGRELWHSAKLAPNPFSQQKIAATCNDCHVDISDAKRDGGGYDLKYFNYSNHAIVSRAQFHQLTAAEGEDIAAYIRALPTPASKYGRPWNPPYQPGAVIATRPVSEWAAGAGLDAVATDQSAVVAALFPSDSITPEDIALGSGKRIDLSTIPSFPLLDWKEWLPTTHPKDGRRITVEGQFEASQLNKQLTALKAALGTRGTPESEAFIKQSLELSINYMSLADPSPEAKATWEKVWDEPAALENYSWAKYRVKEIFGLMQAYEIEGRLPQIFGEGAVSRGWLGDTLFKTNAVPISRGDGGRFQLTQPFGSYTGTAWYHLQAIVNMGDQHREWSGNTPVDGAYVLNINSGFLGLSGYAGATQLYALVLRMMQERASYGDGLLKDTTGYHPHWGQDPTRVFLQSNADAWQQVPQETQRRLLRAIMKAHYDHLAQFSAQEFRDAGQTVEFEAINGAGNGPTFLSRLRAILGYMHAVDPDSPLQLEIAAEADAKFPGFGFAKTATGIGAYFVSIALTTKGPQVLDPNTLQWVDTYPPTQKFKVGETIRLKGFLQGDGTPLKVAKLWYQIDGVEQKVLTDEDYQLVEKGDGLTFTIDKAGEYIVNVLVESSDGVVSGTYEKLTIDP